MSDLKQGMEIWPIGSGKGGVGKTLLTANLGILLSRLDKKVILLDADLGASNLHTALGIPYLHTTLNDLLTGSASSLAEIAIETPFPGLKLIGGGRQLPAYSEYNKELTRKILAGIPSLEADILLVDLGGGIATHTLDLFLLSNQGIAVVTNDPASIQNTYQFLKMAVYRKILKTFPKNPLISYMVHSATHPKSREKIASITDLLEKISHVDHYYTDVIQKILKPFTPRLFVNMVNHEEDRRAADVVREVTRKFVGITPEQIGTLPYHPGIKESTLGLRPFIVDIQNQEAAEQLNLTAHQLLNGTIPRTISIPPHKEDTAPPGEKPVQENKECWLMNNIQHQERPLYVLTEKLNRGNAIQTSIYYHGKILMTKKLDYPELSGHQDSKILDKLVRKQHRTAIKGIEQGRIHLDKEK